MPYEQSAPAGGYESYACMQEDREIVRCGDRTIRLTRRSPGVDSAWVKWDLRCVVVAAGQRSRSLT